MVPCFFVRVLIWLPAVLPPSNPVTPIVREAGKIKASRLFISDGKPTRRRNYDIFYDNQKIDGYQKCTYNCANYKTFKRMIKHAGLKDRGYTVHSLRHGYGSILYQEGVDIKTISMLLRHADIQTTANIYVKPTQSTLKNLLDKIDRK